MAQADNTPSLIDRFNEHRLGPLAPAGADERHEPGEIDRGEDRQVGRRPEDVVAPREERRRQTETPRREPVDDDDAKEGLLQARYKVRTGSDEAGQPIHEELSLEEIAKRGLMEKVISTANQLPNIARKYQELLEQTAKSAKAPEAAAAATPAKKAPPTQEQIYNAFLPMLKATVEAGHIEPDFAEAYPQMATGLMYYRWLLDDTIDKLGHAIAWIQAEANKREYQQTHALLNSAIDVVASLADDDGDRKGDPFYSGLKKPEQREAFIEWLRTDVDPKVGAINAENIQRFWVTYNAKDLLKFTKDAAEKVVEPKRRPRAAGDGSGSRPGKVESGKEPTLLERMTAMRLGE